jgi:hypothetical protein
MACESTLPRPPDRPTGWTCTGEGLVSLCDVPWQDRRVPVAVPLALIGKVFALEAFTPELYDGHGDHMHVVLPEVPQ